MSMASSAAAGALERAAQEQLEHTELLRDLGLWCVERAFSQTSALTLVSLLELVLKETHIIVVDPSPGLLSCCVLALMAIVSPFPWVGAVLPVLPLHVSPEAHGNRWQRNLLALQTLRSSPSSCRLQCPSWPVYEHCRRKYHPLRLCLSTLPCGFLPQTLSGWARALLFLCRAASTLSRSSPAR
jgi:hypothetical protein